VESQIGNDRSPSIYQSGVDPREAVETLIEPLRSDGQHIRHSRAERLMVSRGRMHARPLSGTAATSKPQSPTTQSGPRRSRRVRHAPRNYIHQGDGLLRADMIAPWTFSSVFRHCCGVGVRLGLGWLAMPSQSDQRRAGTGRSRSRQAQCSLSRPRHWPAASARRAALASSTGRARGVPHPA
jgi:hypothetical protein